MEIYLFLAGMHTSEFKFMLCFVKFKALSPVDFAENFFIRSLSFVYNSSRNSFNSFLERNL
jgi:hypothetical protein